MSEIKAPFSLAQVDVLNQFQVGIGSILSGHPFTCPNRSDGVVYREGTADYSKATHGTEGGDRGLLIATEAGFVCPHCGYTQDWAHEAMAKPHSLGVDDQLESTLTNSGVDPTMVLVERADKAIANYMGLYMSRKIRRNQSLEENDKSERIWKTVAFMLASLRRRRMQIMGIHITSDRTLVSIDPSWHSIKEWKPNDRIDVYVLWQDQPYQLTTSSPAVGGVSNPGHAGYGCNAWIDVRSFYEGGILSAGGSATHWREYSEKEVADQIRKLEETISAGPQLTLDEFELERQAIVQAYLKAGKVPPDETLKENFNSEHIVETKIEALAVARKYASIMDWKESRAEAYAESWFDAGNDDESHEALRSFLVLKFSEVENN